VALLEEAHHQLLIGRVVFGQQNAERRVAWRDEDDGRGWVGANGLTPRAPTL